MEQPEQSFWVTTGQFPQVRRTFGEALDECVDGGLNGEKASEFFGFCRCHFGQPGINARLCRFSINTERRGRYAVSEFFVCCTIETANISRLMGGLSFCGALH